MPKEHSNNAKRPAPTDKLPHRVVMFAYPGSQSLDVAGPMEVFDITSRWLRKNGLTHEDAYSVELVAIQAGTFSASSGISMVVKRSFREVTETDTLLVSGGFASCDVMDDQEVLDWIGRMSSRVTRLGSVCTGALILAKAGVLNGRRATTHWSDVQELLKVHPSIRVDPDAIYVRDGHIYTSAGITAGIDMSLAMVEEDWGQAAALAVAQMLVMFLKRPGGQSQFSNHLAAKFSEENKLRELQLWMLNHMDQDLSVTKLAARVAMSERNFTRRFVADVGMTPARYVSSIRLEAARRKLEETDLRISDIGRRCGFGTQETLRRAFVSTLGISPSDYRDRFRSSKR